MPGRLRVSASWFASTLPGQLSKAWLADVRYLLEVGLSPREVQQAGNGRAGEEPAPRRAGRQRLDCASSLTDLDQLVDLSVALLDAADLWQLTERILDAVMSLRGTSHGVIQLHDRRGAPIALSHRGVSCDLIEQCGRIFTGEYFSRRGESSDPVLDPLCSLARKAGFCAVECAPVMVRSDGVQGVLTFFMRASGRADERQIDLIDAYLRLAGHAISHCYERERLRSAREAAERACRSKARVLATASHEIRQPLHALALLNGALSRIATDDTVLRVIAQQDQVISNASELLGTLLDLCKLESGVVQPRISEFDLSGLLSELHAEFAVMAADKGLDLRLEACAGSVRSDRVLVGQILRNLLANAIRYTPAGCVVLRCSGDDRGLRVKVLDTGIGIPAELLPRIFDEFFQAGATRERAGHGLGLSIVQRAARLLGHEVRVRSKVGRGSVFTLVLPRCTAAGGRALKISQSDRVVSDER